LLIGEDDLIPAWTKGGFDISMNDGPDLKKMSLTDFPYADRNSNLMTDLNVGRMIGNLRTGLRTAIESYPNSPSYGNDRSHASLLSGTGDGQSTFVSNVNKCASVLAKNGYTSVKKVHLKDCGSQPTPCIDQFKQNCLGADAIFYSGHGLYNNWGSFGYATVWTVSFGGAAPLVVSGACQTANYGAGSCMAEAFLANGAGAYIGSVPTSLRSTGIRSVAVLKGWGSDTSAGKAFSKVRRKMGKPVFGIMPETYLWWACGFNYFGDPKFGSPDAMADDLAGMTIASVPVSSISFSVPDYIVHSDYFGDGLDFVEIPDGLLWEESGDLLVPFYEVSVNLPPEHRPQNVVLTNRSGLVKETGASIPMTPLLRRPGITVPVLYEGDVEGFFPEQDFRWTVIDNPDGTWDLTIFVFALKYNPLTTDIHFHRNFAFDIDYEEPTAGITLLATDKDEYAPGETVNIDLELANASGPGDYIVEFTILEEGPSRRVAEGLPLRRFEQLRGNGFVSTAWDTTGFGPGEYTLEATIRHVAGSVLGNSYTSFIVGLWRVEVDAFTATPQLITPGTNVSIQLDIANTGTEVVPVDTVVTVIAPDGEQVTEFTDAFELPPPAPPMYAPHRITYEWVAGSMPYYRVTAIARYNGTTTDPVTVTVSVDSDGDGIGDLDDNCPDTANPDQIDSDGDGIGNACDGCPLDPRNDWEGDGICGDADNAPDDPNPGQEDTDGDGIGDACDICPNDPDNDADIDGVCADLDNCPTLHNPDQADADNDGIGDACDCVNDCADLNDDRRVNILDLIVVRNHLGQAVTTENAFADATNDGSINILDMIYVRNELGTGCD